MPLKKSSIKKSKNAFETPINKGDQIKMNQKKDNNYLCQ